MRRIPICLVITDLDNTLYDWVSSFVPAFYAMVEAASQILRIDEDRLLNELQEVHQRYHNSEQPFALLEIRAVVERYPDATRVERAAALDPAFHAFNRVRKQCLTAYPGVRETLALLRQAGCLLVAHTEAVAANSLYRLKALDLARYVDRLYAPAGLGIDHPHPDRLENFESVREMVRLLPPLHKKPDPVVVADICRDYGVPPSLVLYVGDSVARDVAMARMAGATAAWAEYGTRYDRQLWERLVRVTHWTDLDVQRDRKLREESKDVSPDVTLSAFSDLLRPIPARDGLLEFDFRSPQITFATPRSRSLA